MIRKKQIFEGWNFKAFDEKDWKPAVVPGCVHTDLLSNNAIQQPFYGQNEKELQWIDKVGWEYETRFDMDEMLLSSANLVLVFEGLDTYADVYLNGKNILAADNMFRTWKVDVKGDLQSENNHLHIRFRSPIAEDLPKLEKLGYALPASNDQSTVGGLGDKQVSIFARKAPYHYGWDWGPRFVTSGIWREIQLVGWSGCRIMDLFIHQKEVSAAVARVSAIVEIAADMDWEGTLKLSTERAVWNKAVSLKTGLNKIELEIEILEPQLWWCVGLGEPHLYSFKAELVEQSASIAELSVKTGLRSIELIQEKDTYGASFYLELNGVAVFAKGANHIPNDSFTTEVTQERYRHEVASAVASNMNMLRVWGGGIYEADVFYELCDEYGLLVWQDFMFACSMYPGDEPFLENVRHEAADNIRKLRNHPCIALWCGNNEIDSAWSHYKEDAGWGWKQSFTQEIRDKLWADYEQIFHSILPGEVERHMPGIAYWPSSPLFALTGDEHQHATNLSAAGDVHYWGVWHAVEPFENYNINIGRFMSEYGFQSFPEYKSVRTYAEEADMQLESEVMLAHQKNGAGNRLIKQYMDIYMSEPKDFTSFLYMSQVLQAEAMKTAIEAHRRKKPYCMGTLYWQMNDCWPVASWSGMDYYGRWKALQYYVKRSFKPVIISIDGTIGGHTDIHIVSDRQTPVNGQLNVSLYSFAGQLLNETTHQVSLGANTAGRMHSISTAELVKGKDPTSLVMVVRLEENGMLIESKEHYFCRAKEMKLEQPQIKIEEHTEINGTCFTLTTNRLAKQVWLSTELDGLFTDNYFDLIPGHPKAVQFFTRHGAEKSSLQAAQIGIRAASMVDFVK